MCGASRIYLTHSVPNPHIPSCWDKSRVNHHSTPDNLRSSTWQEPQKRRMSGPFSMTPNQWDQFSLTFKVTPGCVFCALDYLLGKRWSNKSGRLDKKKALGCTNIETHKQHDTSWIITCLDPEIISWSHSLWWNRWFRPKPTWPEDISHLALARMFSVFCLPCTA